MSVGEDIKEETIRLGIRLGIVTIVYVIMIIIEQVKMNIEDNFSSAEISREKMLFFSKYTLVFILLFLIIYVSNILTII